MIFFLELLFDYVNLEEKGICFLEVLLSNILDNVNEMLIFFELLK